MDKPKKTTLDFTPRWAGPVLVLAGVYNIIWGALVVLFPNLAFNLFNLEPPIYPELWQCIGMIVGVYGVGYLAASTDPLRHWPIILVGLLGKIFGPIGFLKALWDGVFPLEFGILIIFNDLIWWLPFGLILFITWDVAVKDKIAKSSNRKPKSLKFYLQKYQTDSGQSIFDLSQNQPVLLIFLRHAGCTFCREAMADISEKRESLEDNGVLPVLVDMMKPGEVSDSVYRKYSLEDLPKIHDPERKLYRAMKLRRGRLPQLFGPKTWFRGFEAGILKLHGIGNLKGDGLQMPGVFLIENGRVTKAFRHESAADKPDYEAISCKV